MEIPRDRIALQEFAIELKRKAFSSAEDRKPLYDLLRRYYLYGSYEAQTYPVEYNMVQEKLDTLASFIFSGETTVFAITAKGEDSKVERPYMEMGEVLAEEGLKEYWHSAGIDSVTDLAVLWSMIYSSMFQKILWKSGLPHVSLIHPWNMGVLNESTIQIDRQEVIVHKYFESKASIRRIIRNLISQDKFNQDIGTFLEQLWYITPSNEPTLLPESLRTIILTATTPNIQGTLGNYPLINVFERPYNVEQSVQMHELWIYDDDFDDFRRILLAGDKILIGDTDDDLAKNCYIEGEHPFVKFTPKPLDDYFWGYPEILSILELQNWHTDRLKDIKRMLKKALDPPIASFGMSMADEKMAISQLQEPRGLYQISDSAGKVIPLPPIIPAETFTELNDIRSMTDDQVGLQDVMKGKGTTGVRSRGQAEILSAYGSSKLKGKAMRIEDSIEKVGYLIVELMRKYDDSHYYLSNGNKFIAKQLPDKFTVKIDAHSSSPIFVSEQADMAFALFDRGAIDREQLVSLLRLPMKSRIRFKAKELDENQAKQMNEMAQIEKMKIVNKRS